MEQIIIEKLTQIYDMIKDKLYFMCLTGSSLIPYIKNKHDIDIVLVWKDMKDVKPFYRNETFKQIRQDLHDNHITNIFSSSYDTFFALKMFSYYQYLYQNDFVLGEKQPYIHNMLEESNAYKNVCKTYLTNLLNWEYSHMLYHILTGMYIIQNNSYELTEEQINNINIVHDCKEEDKQKILELYENVKEWLGITQES